MKKRSALPKGEQEDKSKVPLNTSIPSNISNHSMDSVGKNSNKNNNNTTNLRSIIPNDSKVSNDISTEIEEYMNVLNQIRNKETVNIGSEVYQAEYQAFIEKKEQSRLFRYCFGMVYVTLGIIVGIGLWIFNTK